jgi:hypothetical protein
MEESDKNGQVSARKERTNITLLPPNKDKKKRKEKRNA